MADIEGSTILKDAGAGAALGSVIPGVGTLIGGVGGAAVGLVSGLFAKKKAKNILGQNPYPTEAMPPEVLANQQIAQGAATEGMPSEQYQAAQKSIQRNQASAVSASSTAPGGAVRNIGAIQEASNDATGQLNAQSAEMRRQNIGQLLGVNSQVASWKDKLFDWNSRQKYIQNYNYGMGLLGQANQNIMGGVDKLLGTASGAAASGLFGRGSRQPTTQNPYASEGTGLADTGGPGILNPQSVAARYPTINPNSAPSYLNN